MVKTHIQSDATQWLAHFKQLRGEKDMAMVQSALALLGQDKQFCEKGIGLADILLALGFDTEGLAAAVLYPALQAQEIHLDVVTDHFGESSAKLLRDILQMSALGKLRYLEGRAGYQLENVRKMLLAIVADVRAVLVTLAERLWLLRHAKPLSKNDQMILAQETLSIYAPLANRLGLGQLKWEMEDLCLRYLKPDSYKHIATWLATRREEREHYVKKVVTLLKTMLADAHINNVDITGRVKHIYSIYRKMQRKGSDLDEIYDISAVRIIVNDMEDCYAALGVVHDAWEPIAKEFDDYIIHPKPNGYRSIHTAVIGPEGRTVEVQIRTWQMHQESELGVAAHWRYKEGGAQKSSYEAKIVWLRQVMAWQKEVVENEGKHDKTKPVQDLFADRVYVFTPTGDIVDLPQGATPLDFAYHIHSEIGHRCRGAKIDGNIVPLTYTLQMGERVEVLTTKQANPSRDWLNPHLGYLKTARARAKVQHWFKTQDFSQNVTAGREILDKELKRLGLDSSIDLAHVAERFHLKSSEDVLAAVGAGAVRVAQVLHAIQPMAEEKDNLIITTRAPIKKLMDEDIQILGVGNLLTQTARCCKPLPGEEIIGYITQGRGVTIHRKDCSNILHIHENNRRKLIEVEWGKKIGAAYSVDLFIQAYDRHGLVRDITTLFATEKVNIIGIQTQVDKRIHEMHANLTIEINNLLQLEKLLDRLQQIPNIIKAQRKQR